MFRKTEEEIDSESTLREDIAFDIEDNRIVVRGVVENQVT
jgi:hypothetical protein